MSAVSSASVLSPERLATGYSYAAYRELIDDLLAQGRTTGPNQSDMLLRYARLNEQRMSRLDKTVQLLPELRTAVAGLQNRYEWLVLTEGWCGDAAQLVPLLEAVAQASEGRITTHYFLRDENLDLMDRYLTHGSRSIPKLVVLAADTLAEVAIWGPRPAPAHTLYQDLKSRQVPFEELSTQLHTWYAQDKTRTSQRELLDLVQQYLS